MGVDISHRNLAWLSTADDVCCRRKGRISPGGVWTVETERRKLGEIGD